MTRVLAAVLMLACCLCTRTVAIRSLRPNSNRDSALEPETFVEINHGRGKLSATEEVQSLLSTPADGIRQLVKDLLTKPEEHFIGSNAARFRSARSRGPEGAAVAPDSTSEPPLTGEEAKPAPANAKPAENSDKTEGVFGGKETPYTMELQQHKESGGRDGDLVKLQAWLSTASQAVQRAGQLYSTLSGQLNNAVSGAIAQKQSMLNWITEQKSNAMQRIQQIERQVSETALQIEALQAAYSQASSKRDAYANRARQMVAERQLQTAQPISPAVRAAMTPESEYQQQLTEVQNQAKAADDTMKQAGQTLKQAYATVAGGKAWLTAAKSQLAAWLTAQQATVTQRVKNGAGQTKSLQSTLDAVDRVFNQAQVLSHVYHLAITQAEIDARLRYLHELNKLSGKNSRTFTDPSIDTVGQDITQLSGIRGQVTGRLKAILDKYELQGIIAPLKEWEKVLSSVPPIGAGASLATMPGFGGINLGDPSAAYRSPIISDAAFSPRAGFDPSLAASTPFNIQSIGSTPTGLRDMPQVGAAATFAFSSIAPYIGGAPSMPTQLPPPPQISNLDLDFGGSDPLRNLNSAGLPTLPTSPSTTVPPASVSNLPPPPVVPQVN